MVRLRGFFYWPGDWLAAKSNTRQRRAIATWILIALIVTWPMRYGFKDAVWMVWVLSELALILAMLGVVSAETPVEEEEA